MTPQLRLLPTLAAVVAGLVTTTPAAAATPAELPARNLSLAAHSTGRSACTTRAPAGRGVVTSSYTAPAEGFASFSLDGGARRGDWDLAVFDERSGVRLGASQAFRADELVQTWLRAGQDVVLQACRRPGASTRVPARIRYVVMAWPTAGPLVRRVRIGLTNPRAQMPVLAALGIDVDEDVRPDHAFATITSDRELARLTAAGFATRTVSNDLLAADRTVLARDRAQAAVARARLRAEGTGLPSGRTTYRRYDDFQTDLKHLVATHPALVRPVTLPMKTFQGRDQMGVEISARVRATDDQKPTAFIMGVHHAREWPAGEAPMEFAIYLAEQFGRDPRVTRLLKRTRVVVVPIINVDGYIESRQATDPTDSTVDPAGYFSDGESYFLPLGGTLAYRRKNCDGAFRSPAFPCLLQYGVDPNRNYGFNWGGKGASSSPFTQDYRGAGQWSEPETQSVHRFSQTRAITALVTMHNFASLVLRPPGLHTEGKAPDEAALKRLGDAMAADTGYTSQYSYELYDTAGTTEDWNYGAAGTFGYTIEMGPYDKEGGNFHVAYQRGVIDQFNGTGPRAGRGLRSALLALAEEATNRSDFATITGRTLPGRVLHVHKDFRTSSAPICRVANPTDLSDVAPCFGTSDPTSVPDVLDYRTTVGRSGRFTWLITPSTRPFEHKNGLTETWTLTCEDAAGKVYATKRVVLWRGETRRLSLPCGGTLPSTQKRG